MPKSSLHWDAAVTGWSRTSEVANPEQAAAIDSLKIVLLKRCVGLFFSSENIGYYLKGTSMFFSGNLQAKVVGCYYLESPASVRASLHADAFTCRCCRWSLMSCPSINSRLLRQHGGFCSTTALSRPFGTGSFSSWSSTRLFSLLTRLPSSWTSTGTCATEAVATRVTLWTWPTSWWTCSLLWT